MGFIFKKVPAQFTRFTLNHIIRRTKKWYPDAEWISQFDGPVMYPDEVMSKYSIPNWNAKKLPAEKKITNMVINFGPCHPAAHGCLRMLSELDGEVRYNYNYFKYLM